MLSNGKKTIKVTKIFRWEIFRQDAKHLGYFSGSLNIYFYSFYAGI